MPLRRRLRRGGASDCHSGAGSTTRQARGGVPPATSSEQPHPRPSPWQPNGEASSEPPAARQCRRRAAQAPADALQVPDQEVSHLPRPAADAVKEEEEGGNGRDAKQSSRGRGQRATALGSDADPEDVCCQRAQSPRSQEKGKSAGSLLSGQRQGWHPSGNALAGQSRRERRPASPQVAVIQDGAPAAARPQRQLRNGQADSGALPRDGPGTHCQRDAPEAISEAGQAAGPGRLPRAPGVGHPSLQQAPAAHTAAERNSDNPLPVRMFSRALICAKDAHPSKVTQQGHLRASSHPAELTLACAGHQLPRQLCSGRGHWPPQRRGDGRCGALCSPEAGAPGRRTHAPKQVRSAQDRQMVCVEVHV